MASADGDTSTRARPRRAARARGGLSVSLCDARGVPVTAPGLSSWLARSAPAAARGSVTIALVGDARMRSLNRTWRGQDRATDVLSFPTESAESGSNRRPRRHAHLGDIVIATGMARRQARRAGHTLATELRVLALHGLLHLLGYDHERDTGEMAHVERRLLQRSGLRASLIDRTA
jgi:probable rRNA maturation factor